MSEAKSEKEVSVLDTEVCPACGHGVSWHFNDVTGAARCIVIHRGESTKGILGLPWEERCPCKNFQMPPRPQEQRSELPERLKQRIREAFEKASKGDAT